MTTTEKQAIEAMQTALAHMYEAMYGVVAAAVTRREGALGYDIIDADGRATVCTVDVRFGRL